MKRAARRYSFEENAATVRIVRALRAELGVSQAKVQRVATAARLWGRVCASVGGNRLTSTTLSTRCEQWRDPARVRAE